MLERKHECTHNRRVVVQAEAMGRPGLKDDTIEERLNNQRLGKARLERQRACEQSKAIQATLERQREHVRRAAEQSKAKACYHIVLITAPP